MVIGTLALLWQLLKLSFDVSRAADPKGNLCICPASVMPEPASEKSEPASVRHVPASEVSSSI